MKMPGPRVMTLLSVGIGGGSLLLFLYLLIVGAPLHVVLARSEPGRLGWDALLCLVFFLQHSGMIRRGVKAWLARWIPASHYPALYSIASGVALTALVLLWQPSDRYFFRLAGAARWISAGVVLAAMAGFVWAVRSLRSFDPFGRLALRASGRGGGAPEMSFVAEGAYRVVRHPLYLFSLLLLWSTPRLSADQLLLDVLWTLWIVAGTRLEERDLAADFGEPYRRYQRAVPMLVPRTWPQPKKT